MASSANYRIVNVGWFDDHNGPIPDLQFQLPDNAVLEDHTIIQYKLNIWFGNGPLFLSISANGQEVSRPSWTENYFGPYYEVLKRNIFVPGNNVLKFVFEFGPGFEGPSGQGLGDVVLWYQST
ncbi:MAG TPA: hypothetical protein VI756_13220 [Blastocatellia bacterium]